MVSAERLGTFGLALPASATNLCINDTEILRAALTGSIDAGPALERVITSAGFHFWIATAGQHHHGADGHDQPSAVRAEQQHLKCTYDARAG